MCEWTSNSTRLSGAGYAAAAILQRSASSYTSAQLLSVWPVSSYAVLLIERACMTAGEVFPAVHLLQTLSSSQTAS